MAHRLLGALNVALLLGLLQFAGVFVIAWRHGRYRREVLDPLAAQIVADAERRVRSAARRQAAGPGAAPVRPRPHDAVPNGGTAHRTVLNEGATGGGTAGGSGRAGPPAAGAATEPPGRPGTEVTE